MNIPKAHINPKVLSWARESAGFQIEDIVAHLRQKQTTREVIQSWERGQEQPSYTQLEKLAILYKRPLALFFFPHPPEEEPIDKDFRSLPKDIADTIPPGIRYLIRKAKVRQLELTELHNGAESKAEIINMGDKVKRTNATTMAARVRNHVGISVAEQHGWQNPEAALKKWRTAVEALGVWVFKAPFQNNDSYCGFCVYDKNFPIVYLNSSQSKERQIFTLFHELGHLLTGTAGVDFRTPPDFTGQYQAEEVFCNAFAGSFLVPDDSLPDEEYIDDAAIQEYARKYKVSGEVILRRCRDRNMIDWQEYSRRIERWKSKSKRSGNDDGGGNYYANQKSYLGDKYLTLAFSQYYKQRINEFELADYLGVKVSSIPEIEGAMLKSTGEIE